MSPHHRTTLFNRERHLPQRSHPIHKYSHTFQHVSLRQCSTVLVPIHPQRTFQPFLIPMLNLLANPPDRPFQLSIFESTECTTDPQRYPVLWSTRHIRHRQLTRSSIPRVGERRQILCLERCHMRWFRKSRKSAIDIPWGTSNITQRTRCTHRPRIFASYWW